MKKLSIICISLGIISATTFGATAASWAVTDNAKSFSINVKINTPEVKTKVYYQSNFFYGESGTVYAYAWDSKDTSKENNPWPGVAMDAEDYMHGLYSYEVSDKFDKIIFHANVTSDPTKTDDLTIDRNNVYYSQHLNEWKIDLNSCTFAYYMTGVISGVSGWGNRNYENGLLKNFAGNNPTEYLKCDYTFKPNDSFKIIDEDNHYYGTGGTTSGSDFNVYMKNSSNKTVAVYFKPNQNLSCNVQLYYNRGTATSYGDKFWCHHWHDGGSGTTWPGDSMTRDGQEYWYYAYVSIEHDCVVFNNKGSGGSNNFQTADLKGVDYATPYFNGTWKASKNG